MKTKMLGLFITLAIPLSFINTAFFMIGLHMDAWTIGPDAIYGASLFCLITTTSGFLGALIWSGYFDNK